MKFLREPLVHFLLIGAALFGIFSLFGQTSGEAPAGTIAITPQLVENLKLSYTRAAGQPPTPAQVDAAIEDYIREEVFFREAKAQGLDKDDPLVRRQLRTRMEATYEDSAQAPVPTEDQLSAFLKSHLKDFPTADGHTPSLAEIHAAVQDAWLRAQRKAAVDDAYQKLRARYRIVLPPPATADGTAKK